MGKETFLLLFVLGCSLLAVWVAVRLPGLAPTSFRSAGAHLVVAIVAGSLLTPALTAVPGLPSEPSLLVALFGVGLPVLTYMQLVGLWLIQLAAAQMPFARR
jgi:hypothetical protein